MASDATLQHNVACGCGTVHVRVRLTNEFNTIRNVACIEGASALDFPEVHVVDGVSHTSDTGTSPKLAGILRFEPTKL